MDRRRHFIAFAALASVIMAPPVVAQRMDGAAGDLREGDTTPTPETAAAWLESLDLANEAETFDGGMVVRRGYLSEAELDLAMLPALQLAGLQDLLKLDEKGSGRKSAVEVAWFEPIDHPGTRCAALLQSVILTPIPSKEVMQGLADYRLRSPFMRLGSDCNPIVGNDEQGQALPYIMGEAGRILHDRQVRCSDFVNRPRHRLTISRYTAFAHDIRHNADDVSHRGVENINLAARWTRIGLSSGLKARDLPYMTYLTDGFTLDRSSDVALTTYMLDEKGADRHCVALVARQGPNEWVGVVEEASNGQVAPASSAQYMGGWNASDPLKRLGMELAASLAYSPAGD